MGEDLVNATIALTAKSLDIILKLLQLLSEKAKSDVSSRDMTDIKPGAIKVNDLEKHCRKTGDLLVTSDQGITKDDMKKIVQKAKENGISVAFKGAKNKDNIHPCCCKSDLDIFKNICTEVMQEKIADRPQDLGNFKVKSWEIPFITAEFNEHDLSAQFGKAGNGEYFCLFEKSDEKAIKIARNEFVRKCSEIENEITMSHEENSGFYTISDKRSGKEITFDSLASRSQLSMQIQSSFGYDSIKADILCAKFGQDCLTGEDKKKYFSNDPQNEFSKIDTKITLKGESILVKPFPCWRLTPKIYNDPKIVYQGENGSFCVLQPEVSTRKGMAKKLREDLNIKDEETINALVAKAEGIVEYYKSFDKQNLTCTRQFSMDQDENGNYTLKDLDSGIEKKTGQKAITTEIQRTGRDTFKVSGIDHPELVLSFSNKKTALQKLKEMYCEIGISEAVAKSMAKEVFNKADMQSAEQVLELEEIKIKESELANVNPQMQVTVRYGNKTHEFNVADKEKAIKEISEHYQLPESCAVQVLEQAMEQVENRVQPKEQFRVQNTEADTVYYESDTKSEQRIDEPKNSIDLTKTSYQQPEKMSFKEAMNRLPEKNQFGSYDNIVICNPDNPNNYIVSQAHNNGNRIVHEYSVYCDGIKQSADDVFGTGGIFTDEGSLDENNEPNIVSGTTYWNALKTDMEKKGHISGDVLVFKNQSDFESYKKEAMMSIANNTPEFKSEIPMTRSVR